MSMLFISIFIIPSMEMYAVPTSNEQNLELSVVSGPIDSKEIETNYSPVQEELLHEMSDANVMEKSDISRISESFETIKLDQEHASNVPFYCRPRTSLIIAGISISIFIGLLCLVVVMICATSQTDFQSMNTALQPLKIDLQPLKIDLQPLEIDLQPMETGFQSIIRKVIFGLLLVIVIFTLTHILFFSVLFINSIVNC